MGKQNIVYVMRHIDIGGNVNITYKKIGITGSGNANLNNRVQEISGTKSPIKALCIFAWSHNEAQKIEKALHDLLEDNRVEPKCEWFKDENDTLVDRLKPIMELIGAEVVEEFKNLEVDKYTQKAVKKQDDKASLNKQVLDEIMADHLLNKELKTSLRGDGPTIRGDDSELTFYVYPISCGAINLRIGRSRKVFEPLKTFLYNKDKKFVCEPTGNKEEAIIYDVSVQEIATIINDTEAEFKAYLKKAPKSDTTPTKQ